MVSFILPGKLINVDKLAEHHARVGTICGKGGLGMAAIFGPGRPIVLLWTVWGATFEGEPSTTRQADVFGEVIDKENLQDCFEFHLQF